MRWLCRDSNLKNGANDCLSFELVSSQLPPDPVLRPPNLSTTRRTSPKFRSSHALFFYDLGAARWRWPPPNSLARDLLSQERRKPPVLQFYSQQPIGQSLGSEKKSRSQRAPKAGSQWTGRIIRSQKKKSICGSRQIRSVVRTSHSSVNNCSASPDAGSTKKPSTAVSSSGEKRKRNFRAGAQAQLPLTKLLLQSIHYRCLIATERWLTSWRRQWTPGGSDGSVFPSRAVPVCQISDQSSLPVTCAVILVKIEDAGRHPGSRTYSFFKPAA